MHSPVDCRAYNAQVAWNKHLRSLSADAGRSVRTVPAPPDYSSREAVTERCHLSGGDRSEGDYRARAWYWNTFKPAARSVAFKRLYVAFRAACTKGAPNGEGYE